MNDSYLHSSNTVMYVEENIPGPPEDCKEYEEIINSYNSQITSSCTCNDKCLSVCECHINSGGENYLRFNPDNKETEDVQFILKNDKDFNTYPIFECNSLCQCSMNCGNRLVQYGPRGGLNIKPTKPKQKGFGLFTTLFIPQGGFVCEYAGEIITKAQALNRHRQNVQRGDANYIYCINEHTNGKTIQTIIDPSKFGNIGRYINHSCEPNCILIPVRVDNPIPKLAVFSCMDIIPTTELTFNYSTRSVQNLTNQQNTMNNYFGRKKCLCKSKTCCGWMPFDLY